jgi:hypothetical protein
MKLPVSCPDPKDSSSKPKRPSEASSRGTGHASAEACRKGLNIRGLRFLKGSRDLRFRYLEHQNDWHLWPKSLNKNVVVGILLNAIEEQIGEEELLEMCPEELDAVE